ncbi:MAG: tRNA (adenosine(37)-N6)-threonylcarbamoyltransferase complex dimerization subunit type 1 TsaB [Anaerolineae bacterium]|jgi:tRNA threonylcarbamoyladenosine biosynthesis protein TsaB
MLLAVDTATQMAGVALYDHVGGKVLGEESWSSVNRHTVELMPRLTRLMDLQGVTPVALTGLAVSLGPGSFTGLRIGMGVVKGLALAQGLPLVGIPTLDLAAHPHTTQKLPIWAVLQAGRGRICAAYYVRRKGDWKRQGDYQLTTLDKLCEQVTDPALFCGEIDAQGTEQIRRKLGLQVIIATPAASVRRAAYLAELGWERLSRGDSDDASTLSPIYLHQPAIND